MRGVGADVKTLLAHIDATAPEVLTLKGREHIAAFAAFLRACEELREAHGARVAGLEYDRTKRAAFPEDYPPTLAVAPPPG